MAFHLHTHSPSFFFGGHRHYLQGRLTGIETQHIFYCRHVCRLEV